MELYNQYINNEISLVEYISQSSDHMTYELSAKKSDELIEKIKKDIKAKDRLANIHISLMITSDDAYALHLTENYKLKAKLTITLNEILEKEKVELFGKSYYLLGEGIDGEKYYLQKAVFNRVWYQDGSYIVTLNCTKTNINCSIRYNSGDINGYKLASFEGFNNAFKITTMTKEETWVFYELMRTLSTAREAMCISLRGNSGIGVRNDLSELIRNEDVYNHFDKVARAIDDELDKLLSPAE